MDLAYNGIVPPKEWEHKHDIKAHAADNLTVALILSDNGIVPPKQWNHNLNIKDKDGWIVEDYLKENKIKVPKYWKTR